MGGCTSKRVYPIATATDYEVKRIMAAEKRDYFRIEDKVLLKVAASSKAAAKSGQLPAIFNTDDSLNLTAQLRQLDHDNQSLLMQLGHQNKDLEAYLKSINKKIDMIAAKIAQDHQSAEKPQMVSISEGGVSFSSKQAFSSADVIAIQLTLLPSYVTLTLFGEVISCKESNSGYSIASSFLTLSDTNRQVLAKHIMQVQLAAKRQLNQDQ